MPESGDRDGASCVASDASATRGGPEQDDELERELRARLGTCPATRDLATGELTRLPGGFSNHAWRLDVPGGPWYARLNAADAEALGVDRDSECALLKAVGASGLAPAVLACEPANRLLVTRYVKAQAWRAEEAANKLNIKRLATTLRRLHELPVSADVAYMDWLAQARRLAAGLAESPGDARVHQRAAEVFRHLAARDFVPTLCHHDLHHLNILDDGARLWLVDWEYGGRGDPLFDLAGFVSMNGLDTCSVEIFVDAYGRLELTDREQFVAACWAFDYVQWLWYRLRPDSGAGEAAARSQRLARRLLHCDNRPDTQADG